MPFVFYDHVGAIVDSLAVENKLLFVEISLAIVVEVARHFKFELPLFEEVCSLPSKCQCMFIDPLHMAAFSTTII